MGSGDPAGLCPSCLILGAFDSSLGAEETETQTNEAEATAAGDDDFGRYRIVRALGEGGMGTVYLAEQLEPIRRRVALKVVKLGMDTAQVLARFNNERQALAMMEHPNIAHIFDAGVTSRGRPYFVMEYIEGAPITQYCDRKRMTTKERLGLFLAVCRAVQHAHQKRVIHRDLKPSNVLVTEQDGTPVPKVIDFGIAKATDKWAVDNTLVTEFGQIVGTPEYASPEQADTMTGAIDELSDVYSLGVVLYELMIGAVPFETATLRGAGLAEMLRIIREEEAPPLPRKLTSMGARASEIAARRQTDPVSLRRLVNGDLNAITMKALEKARERRYASVADLAADIERHLEHRPVLASPPSRIYRTRKFLRRHRMAAIGTAAGVVFAVLSSVTVWSLARASSARPKLTDKDTIVLADFVNYTGDPIFDSTLRQGLAIQLEQSPFLKIMEDEHVRRVVRRMSLRPDARVTNPVAREICVREGATATIDGTIASLGTSYVLTLEAVACQNGATLAREQIQAAGKEHVLSALGTAATGMRGKLGESHNSIQKLNRPLEEATTASLEALQTYSAAYNEMRQGRFLATVPLWERVIAIDPNFAMAYFYLGVAFDQAGDMARARENATRALRLVDRVSERERASITGFYYLAIGEWDKAIDAYQLAVRNFPRDWGFHNQMAAMYNDLGRYEDGLKEGLEASRLSANTEPPYRRQLDAFLCLNRLPEAKQLAARLRADGIDGPRIHQRFLEMAYIEEDQGAMVREIQWFAGKPSEYISLSMQAAYRNVHGQRRESKNLFQRAAEAALRQGLKNAASEIEEADARAEALVGNCQNVGRLGRPALALAMCGDAGQAEKLAANSSKLFPNGTLWNAVQLPAIRAAVALGRDQPAKSVEHLVSAVPYERGNLEAIYLRGLAYLRLKKGAEAAAEFRKILHHKGANWASAWRYPYWGQFYSLSHLGLARSGSVNQDKATARKAFQDFFELWKDADPDLPVLRQAKAEYAMLR